MADDDPADRDEAQRLGREQYATELLPHLTQLVATHVDTFQALAGAIRTVPDAALSHAPPTPPAEGEGTEASGGGSAESIIRELCNCKVLESILGHLGTILGL